MTNTGPQEHDYLVFQAIGTSWKPQNMSDVNGWGPAIVPISASSARVALDYILEHNRAGSGNSGRTGRWLVVAIDGEDATEFDVRTPPAPGLIIEELANE
jgi:hypothetical protein